MIKKLTAVAMMWLVWLPTLGAAPVSLGNGCDLYFSPRGETVAGIVRLIDSSRSSIYLNAYSYTSVPIGMAVRRALERGVKVYEIVDKSAPRSKYTQVWNDQAAGAIVLVDFKHKIAHSKTIVVDEIWFVTGSYNFSSAAEYYNTENTLICKSPIGAKVYIDRWHYLKQFTTPLK